MRTLPSERGQAIVLIVIAIVGLFGFAALAIDLGQVYAARRSAQNAADAAALAAAYEASAGSQEVAKAIDQGYAIALTNGYNNDQETNWVLVNNPPIDGPYCYDCTGIDGDYYQVKITTRLHPIFAQMIFSGMEEVTVEAVAHSATSSDVSAGNALMSLNEKDDKAMNLDGGPSVIIDGGNIRSNGGFLKKGCAGNITVNSGSMYYGNEDWIKVCDKPLNQTPSLSAPVRISGFKAPACPTKAEAASWASEGAYKYKEDTTYGSTTYYWPSGLSNKSKSILDLPPGIHCIDGGIGKGQYSGTGVLIVLLSGDIQQTGGDSFDFRAATDIKDSKGNQFGGLVFYAPPTNTSKLKFGGNSNMYIQGTFFAPGAECEVGGNEEGTAYHTAIICDTVKVHGTPDLLITFKPEELFHFPPRVELVQ